MGVKRKGMKPGENPKSEANPWKWGSWELHSLEMWVKETKMKKERAFDEVVVRECEREDGIWFWMNLSIYLCVCLCLRDWEFLGFYFFFVFEKTRQSKVLMEEVTLGFMWALFNHRTSLFFLFLFFWKTKIKIFNSFFWGKNVTSNILFFFFLFIQKKSNIPFWKIIYHSFS